MKISMIFTSLVVAMSAMSLTACDYKSDSEKKTSYKMEQSSDMIEKSDDMKKEETEAMQPVPPPTPE